MNCQTIFLLPIDEVEKTILEHLGNVLQKTFKIPFQIISCDNVPLHSEGLLHENKYNSTAVLLYITQGKCLNDNLKLSTSKVLIISQLDLYSPIFSYLYGEAQLNGTAALISLFRLHQEFYYLPPNPDIFLSRCEKEALHELGHTFGLVHCRDKNCVMYPSSTIQDTDTKSNSFCLLCNRLLKN